MNREIKDNLNKKYYETLLLIINKSQKYEVEHLFDACTQHANHALEKFKENPLIDFDTAEKIAVTFKELETKWPAIDHKAQEYFKAAMYYFAISEDDEHDFASFTGFDDDVEILNACLKFAELDDMIIELRR